MSPLPKPLDEQVVVILGASSGIGRLTALEMAKKGATVVLASRNEKALETLVDEIQQTGGRAEIIPTDIGEWEQVENLAKQAAERFGHIDTWVNNAGISVYGTIDETPVEELERIIHINLVGYIYATKAVLPYMKRQNQGTIINVASVLAARAAPLLATYSASKHAVSAFSEGLRLELKHAGHKINVTVIYPSSMNTPFFNHARSYLGAKPMPLKPVYDPKLVAESIVHAAEHPQRDIFVGGGGKFLSVLQNINPRLVDWYLMQNDRAFNQQNSNLPDDPRDNLFETVEEGGRVYGDYSALEKSASPYTRYLELHPNVKRGIYLTLASLAAFRRVRSAFRAAKA
jgi:short-subunit dehydrogenase